MNRRWASAFLAIVLHIGILSFHETVTAKTSHACFTDHLNEAIALNQRRKPVYSRLSARRSIPISETLISSEWFSKLFARGVERDAKIYEKKGVNILCDAFISMSKVPVFQENTGLRHDPRSFRKFDNDDLEDLLEDLNDDLRFEEIFLVVEQQISQLNQQPHFHCMIRHVLESVRRIAYQAPLHDRKALALGLPSSLELSKKLISLHLLSFSVSSYLDKAARPLQAQGIPILCQDVPPIDAP